MATAQLVGMFAVRFLAGAAGQTAGLGGTGEAVASFLTKRFTDHSQRLTVALELANQQAWRALEIALAGDSLWERCKSLAARGEDRAFADQVRAFLDADPLPPLDGKATTRPKMLSDLRAARKAGTLGGKIDPAKLATQAAGFARFTEPQAVLDAEWKVMTKLAEVLHKAGYVHLGWLLGQRPVGGPPLLVAATQYFFRRQVEQDPALFQGLAFAKLEALGEGQERAFAALDGALRDQGERIEKELAGLQEVVVQTHGAVLDLREQMKGQSEQIQQIGQAVLQLLDLHQMQKRELRPGDSLSVRDDGERAMIKRVVARYRALPEDQRHSLPALLNGIGKLQVAAGDFEAAREDFEQVAALTPDVAARAEARYNAYRAALERGEHEAALKDLIAAAELQPARYAPFPLEKYLPQRILGAGGFGTAFLCRHRYMNADVVVKALHLEALGQDPDKVFAEAQALRQLDHPAIIRVSECGYSDAESRSRPHLVMDYFPGQTLEDYVRERGPLEVPEALAVIRQLAEGLRAAHEVNILHRDVKPANVLVSSPGVRGTALGWKVKLIDFGLAMPRKVAASTGRADASSQKSVLGSSIAGTMDYAPPEQMGRRAEPVAAYSDVFGWAKTCCFALFGTPQPLRRHWESIPRALADLLEACLDEDPKGRPTDFAAVLQAPAWPRKADPETRDSVRKRRDDEDDDRPRRKKPKTGGSRREDNQALIAIAVVGGTVMLVSVIAVVAFVLFARPKPDDPVAAVRPPEVAAAPDPPAPTPVERPKPVDPPIEPVDPPVKTAPPFVKKGGSSSKKAPDRTAVVRVALPAQPEPLEIKPAPVTKEKAVPLDEPAASLRPAGGGRFLVLHFPKSRKFGLFDVNEAKIVRRIDAGEDDVQYAAGMTHLISYLPGSGVMRRHDLLTGTQEQVSKFEMPAGQPLAFCMGHASAGPLLVSVRGHGAKLYDPLTLKEIPLPELPGRKGYIHQLEEGRYWAGATGRVFGATGVGGSPSGIRSLVLAGGTPQLSSEHLGPFYVMPGPDDRHVYPGGFGVASDRIRPVPNVPFSMSPGGGFASHLYLPALHGPYYLHASTIEGFGRRDADEAPVGTVRLYRHGDKAPIATYEKTVVSKYRWEGLKGFGVEHSVQLIPKARLLVIVPEGRDELRLYPADLEAALDKTGRDYLIFTSTPPASFEKGKEFRYRVEAKAKNGPVKFELGAGAGPDGMAVTPDGVATWQVPADFAGERVDVVLSAKAGEQEAFHSFSLTAK